MLAEVESSWELHTVNIKREEGYSSNYIPSNLFIAHPMILLIDSTHKKKKNAYIA